MPLNPGEAQISPQSLGRQFEGLAQVGRALDSVQNEYLKQQTQAEAADAIRNRSQEDLEAIEAKKEELKGQFSKIDPVTNEVSFDPRGAPEQDELGNVSYPNSYSTQMKAFLADRFEQGQGAMPSNYAKERYLSFAGEMTNRETVRSIGFEQEETAKALAANMQRGAQVSVDSLYRNPDLGNLSNQMAVQTKFIQENKEGLLKGTDLNRVHEATARGMVTDGFFRGLLQKDPAMGLKILQAPDSGRGVDPLKDGANPRDSVGGSGKVDPSMVKRYLTKDDIADWTERFKGKIQEKNNVEIYHINNRLADVRVAALTGQGNVGIGEVKQLIDRQASLGLFKSGEERVRAYSDAFSDIATGQAIKELGSATNQELMNGAGERAKVIYDKALGEVAKANGVKITPEFAAKDQYQIAQKSQAAVAHLMEQRRRNPAAAVLSSNDSVQEAYKNSQGGMGALASANEAYYAVSMAEQARVGAKPAPLQAEVAKSLAANIMTSDPGQAALQVEDLRHKTGKYFQPVMNQLIKDGNLPEFYAVSGYVDSPDAAKSIIDNFRNKGSFEKVLQDKSLLYKKSELTQQVNKDFQPYFESIVGAGSSSENVKVAVGLRSAVQMEAANQIARGVPAAEASQKALATVIGNTQEVYKGALIPKKNSEMVKSQMNFVTSDAWIKNNSHNVYMPMGDGRLPDVNAPLDIRGTERRAQEKEKAVGKFLQDANAHRWVTKPDGSGATLNFVIKKNGESILLPARTLDQRPIEIDFSAAAMKYDGPSIGPR